MKITPPTKIYTPEEGREVLEQVRREGYPHARLIGSLGMGKTSSKDIDILVPIRNKKKKQAFFKWASDYFKPTYMNPHMGWYQFGIITQKYGVVDFFFTERYFDNKTNIPADVPSFDIKDRVVSLRGNVGNVVGRKFVGDILFKCLVKFDSGKCSWCLATHIFYHPTEMVLSPKEKKMIFKAIGEAGVEFLTDRGIALPSENRSNTLIQYEVMDAVNKFSNEVYRKVIHCIETNMSKKQ